MNTGNRVRVWSGGVSTLVLSLGLVACVGNISNSVCEPEKLVGEAAEAVVACYGPPAKVAHCNRPGCTETEERWFYTDVWAEREVDDAPPFACVVVIEGKVIDFIYDSIICAIGSPEF